MGALDANGIYQYDETDQSSPRSDLLNLLAESTSDHAALVLAYIAAHGGPFRMAIGTTTATISVGNNSAPYSIMLPAARFTVAPVILAFTNNASSGAWHSATGTSPTAGSGRAYVADPVGVSTVIPVVWVAFQMLAGSAAG